MDTVRLSGTGILWELPGWEMKIGESLGGMAKYCVAFKNGNMLLMQLSDTARLTGSSLSFPCKYLVISLLTSVFFAYFKFLYSSKACVENSGKK